MALTRRRVEMGMRERRDRVRGQRAQDYAAEHVTDHAWPVCGHSHSFIPHSVLGLLSTSGTADMARGPQAVAVQAEGGRSHRPSLTRSHGGGGGAGPVGVQNRDLLAPRWAGTVPACGGGHLREPGSQGMRCRQDPGSGNDGWGRSGGRVAGGRHGLGCPGRGRLSALQGWGPSQ